MLVLSCDAIIIYYSITQILDITFIAQVFLLEEILVYVGACMLILSAFTSRKQASKHMQPLLQCKTVKEEYGEEIILLSLYLNYNQFSLF